ncbi:UNVERIFIED_ORG: putative GH43/DUF377 family glycosyl hydrolase [Sphingomonas sp. R1F5B]
MKDSLSRRAMLAGSSAAAGTLLLPGNALANGHGASDPVAPFRTPYKLGRLILGGSKVAGRFDEKAVDCPFVFRHEGRFYLTYVGFDGTGYQTGIAVSDDLVNWQRQGVILARDPSDPVTRFNVASASILRETEMHAPGELIRVNGEYVCAWHAYPSPGYEEGPAVIGLAFSRDLRTWRRGPPILRAQDGAAWERGGLYKPYLVKHGNQFLLYYNAKTAEKDWHEQTGVAVSTDLKTWRRHPGNPILRNGAPPAPDSRFASDPVVMTHQGRWAMFYFGLSGTDYKARDLLALGRDPFTFHKVDEVMIDVGKPGSVDDGYAHKPSVIFWKGDLYHFYTAVSGPYPNDVRGISVCRSRPWS